MVTRRVSEDSMVTRRVSEAPSQCLSPTREGPGEAECDGTR
jgi:hypothetical protein